VPGYEGIYDVSSLGRVRSLERLVPSMNRHGPFQKIVRGKILKGNDIPAGYKRMNLCKNGKARIVNVHLIVAEAYLGPRPSSHVCRHLNGYPHDNRAVNLAWGTHKENARDMVKHGTTACGERSGQAKLTEADVRCIRHLLNNTELTQRGIGRIFDVKWSAIWKINNGKSWAHVE
jgi:hypothetical protein